MDSMWRFSVKTFGINNHIYNMLEVLGDTVIDYLVFCHVGSQISNHTTLYLFTDLVQ